MSKKIKQLIIDNKTFKNTNGTKTRIELTSNNKVIPYKKDLWKSETLQLFSNISIKKYGKMHTRKKNPKKIIKNKTVKVQLYNDDNSIGPVIWVGFDKNGDVVAYEKQAGNTTTIVDTDIATQARMDKFFQIHLRNSTFI